MLKTTLNRCYLRTLACGAIALALTACGGGGGGGESAQLAASGTQSPVSASAATTPVAGTTPASTSPAPATPASTPAPLGQDANAYTLTFADEFESGLSANAWNDKAWYETSNETQNYTVENGALKIWPQKDASGKFFNRTIDTDGKFTQTYGYFEIEAKLPVGKGTWPAFWLFNHINERRPEIDVMEAYAGGAAPWGTMVDGQPHPTMFSSTVWRTIDQQIAFKKIETPDLSAGFHKYGLKWEPNKLTFYFDGQPVYSADVTMSDPMYLMLDLWFGSASGQADDTTPQGKSNSYEVNYIRAWQFK